MSQKNIIRGLSGISLKQLRAVDAVARTHSISRAAQELGLTPPAVHTQLRSLERLLGCAVVKRGEKSGMVLTPEGQLVLQAHRAVEVALKSCLNQIEAMKKGLAGQVTLGVVSTAKYFAPVLVAALKKSFPDMDVVLQVGNREDVLQALSERSVDLAIMGRPPRQPAVVARPVGVHPMVIIASPDHPLARVRKVSPEALLEQVFIAREEGSGTRILMVRYLDRIGEGRLYETLEMGSNETIKQAVMAGLGIAMISQHTVTEELKAGRLVAIAAPELPIERQWYVLHREDLALTPTMRSVWEFIIANCRRFLPSLGEVPDPALREGRVWSGPGPEKAGGAAGR